MKKLILSLALVGFLFSCNNNTPQTGANADANIAEAQYFGEIINEENVIQVSEIKTSMGDKTEMNAKITGEISDVCQKKGCWMDMKSANGDVIKVTFKDYGFFVPLDASGKTAIAQGVAKVEETSVDMLKEYAKDAGKSAEEIAAIKEPVKELVFEASGVIIK